MNTRQNSPGQQTSNGSIQTRVFSFARNFIAGWKHTRRLERTSVTLLAVSMGLHFLHLISDVYVVVDRWPLFFFGLWSLPIFFGLIALLLLGYQRIGRLSAELEQQRRDESRKIEELKARASRRRSAICEALRNLTDETRRVLCSRDLSPVDIVNSLVKYADNLSETFSRLHDDVPEFRTTIKLFDAPGEIVTVARDSKTQRKWRPIQDANRRYSPTQNTAFLELSSGQNDVFACDNLMARANYIGSHDFQRLYNATMVAVIRDSSPDAAEGFEIVGFLGIDCKLPAGVTSLFTENGRPHQALADLMVAYATLAYMVIKHCSPKRHLVATENGYSLDEENLKAVKRLHHVYVCRGDPAHSGYAQFGKAADISDRPEVKPVSKSSLKPFARAGKSKSHEDSAQHGENAA